MKKIAITAMALLIAMPVHADIQTYTDQCLTFQYDDEMHGTITKIVAPAGGVYYNLETADTQSGVAILPVPEEGLNGVICDDKTEYFNQVKISDNETETIYPETGLTLRLKVLAVNDSQYAYVTYDVNKESDESQAFLDSVQIDDSFKEGFMFENSDSEFYEETRVYRNKCYSEQAVVYAEQALKVCNQYLDFKMKDREACSAMEEIEKRLESYMESTKNAKDSDVKKAIFLLNIKISMNNDAEVIEKRDELRKIVDAGADLEDN